MVEAFVAFQAGVAALAGGLEHHHPQGHMHLGGGQPGAIGVHHGFHHVIDKPANFRIAGVRHGLGGPAEDRVPHPGDFQDCHGQNMSLGRERRKTQKVKSCR